MPPFSVVSLALRLAAGSLSPLPVLVEPRCAGQSPWVRVQLRATGWTKQQTNAVVGDLARSLGAQGIAACMGDEHPTREPLATLEIDLRSEEKATVDIEVRDAVTHKRVRRDVDLAAIPLDGRELAIAIEADELLRASWAEVAFDTARARVTVPPPEVVSSVAEVLPPEQKRLALGVRGAAEHFVGGLTWFGGDALTWRRFASRGEVELAAGMRSSTTTTAPHGLVHAWAAGGSLACSLRWLETARGVLTLGAVLGGSWVELRADPATRAVGDSYASWLLTARARLAGRLAMGHSLQIIAGVEVGDSLLGVQGTDAGVVVAKATGPLLAATLGIETP